MLRLAVPLVAAELGWMTMGLVDTMMVGRMPNSAQAMGAVGLGDILFFTVAIIGVGILLGLDTLVSQAFGAGDVDKRQLFSRARLERGRRGRRPRLQEGQCVKPRSA